MQPTSPFTGKPLRCLYDKAEAKWWYSAVDFCAMLTDSDYDSARQYWKRLKHQLRKRRNQMVQEWDQLKMPASNGKYYFTDVLDLKEAIYLIQIIPSPKAEPFRLWLAETVANNTNIESMLIEAGAEYAKQIEEYKKNSVDPFERLVITKRPLVQPAIQSSSEPHIAAETQAHPEAPQPAQ